MGDTSRLRFRGHHSPGPARVSTLGRRGPRRSGHGETRSFSYVLSSLDEALNGRPEIILSDLGDETNRDIYG